MPHPRRSTASRAAAWKRILDDHGLQPVAYAGQPEPGDVEICQWLGIPQIDGSLGSLSPAQATAFAAPPNVRFNLREPSGEERRGNPGQRSAAATNGWGSAWTPAGWARRVCRAPEAIRDLRPLVRHTHIKDVKAAGAHETCLLGEGVVDVAGACKALREIGYAGWYSWEDEPEDRNPFDSAVRNRRWIEQHLS